MKRVILALTIMAVLASKSEAQPHLGSCDLVLHWDENTLSRCIEELQNKLENSELSVRTLEAEIRVLRGHVCLMAQDLQEKSPNRTYALIIEDSCAELKARAKKKSK
jgi:hypothetical protein